MRHARVRENSVTFRVSRNWGKRKNDTISTGLSERKKARTFYLFFGTLVFKSKHPVCYSAIGRAFWPVATILVPV